MNVGTVRETKNHEYRVGLTPDCVAAYAARGHRVTVEKGAGAEAGYADADYLAAGAVLADSARDVFAKCDMVVKVKEPTESEYPLLRSGLILYTYLHLAADRRLTDELLAKGVSGVAYETIEDRKGGLPCLRPMSEIAGRLSVQHGARCLEKPAGGAGILLGGVPGVDKGKIVVLGGGTVGINACKMAVGLGALVTVIDNNLERLAYLDDIFGGRVKTLYNNQGNLRASLAAANVVIGAVLVPGAGTPKLVRRSDLAHMQKGAVVVDVAVDQGGCFETSRPTTHQNPTFEIDGIVHYCVGNMPGAVPRTSTQALVNATLPYGLAIADFGLREACRRDAGLLKGLNTHRGLCACKGVADTFGIEYAPADKALA